MKVQVVILLSFLLVVADNHPHHYVANTNGRAAPATQNGVNNGNFVAGNSQNGNMASSKGNNGNVVNGYNGNMASGNNNMASLNKGNVIYANSGNNGHVVENMANGNNDHAVGANYDHIMTHHMVNDNGNMVTGNNGQSGMMVSASISMENSANNDHVVENGHNGHMENGNNGNMEVTESYVNNVDHNMANYGLLEAHDGLFSENDYMATDHEIRGNKIREDIEKIMVDLIKDELSLAIGKTNAVTDKGADQHEFCCYWAGNNECDLNYPYMRTKCQKSCGTVGCELPDAKKCRVELNIDDCPYDPALPKVWDPTEKSKTIV